MYSEMVQFRFRIVLHGGELLYWVQSNGGFDLFVSLTIYSNTKRLGDLFKVYFWKACRSKERGKGQRIND